jgi:3-deoxy-7-phosphoheptulonate synthase
MVIAMRPNCPKGDVARVIAAIREFDLQPRLISPDSPVVLGVVEEISPRVAGELKAAVGACPGVEEITDFAQSWRLVSRSWHPQPTVVEFGGRRVGDGEVLIVAGPCAVESRELLLETALALAEAGAGAVRGGAFKPRTSPYSFRGLGEEGLKILAEARDVTGLPVITEVLTTQEVDLVAAYADVLQVGARNMQNFALLEAVGRQDKPVLLKRGLMASVKELLLSAEYILAQGNWQVMLCERGIRTFETETRNTLDLSAVPVLKQHTHLPVIVDPSHAAGKRELVPALARAAVAAGADGIMVEVHPRPAEALSDGRQSLTLGEFREMSAEVSRVARAVGRFIPGVAA